MKIQNYRIFGSIFFFFFLFTQSNLSGQRSQPDNFRGFLKETINKMPVANSGIYREPQENDFQEWSKILRLFQSRLFDSCKQVLSHYNYELIQIKDALTENVYDAIREKYPIRYGWGTFIYNRNHKKRLFIQINHPLDDPNALMIGSEIFRQVKGEWLFIAGTSRKVIAGKLTADAGRMRQTMFQHWHEMLSNLTFVALSIHSYDERSFQYPINNTDIIVSNGRTSDFQWGISQLSLAFRDTLRTAGYSCGLAMYDSGYARLAGGWNTQGIFSNDSLGFGHWLYIELSRNVREKSWGYSKLITAFDRGLDLTGKKISQQVNRGFGLVSPRVIKVDSGRRLFFPPENDNTYRIVSFDAKKNRNDTIDMRMGNWVNGANSRKTVTAVTILDSSSKDFLGVLKRSNGTTMVSKMMETPKRQPSVIKFKDNLAHDTTSTEEDEEGLFEPIQVHRIPLSTVLDQTIGNQSASEMTAFKWEGMITGWFTPTLPTFDMGDPPLDPGELNLPRFLIPLINSSYKPGMKSFLGVQMTTMLVNEIARLVTEYEVYNQDIGLIAERSDEGEFYLRIIPSTPKDSEIAKLTR